MKTILTNIKQLLQVRDIEIRKVAGVEMNFLPMLENAYLLIENDQIADYGLMQNLPKIEAHQIIDCTHRIVLPTWCDSHTHLVYAGNREQEFVDRINGLSYEEIANRGGGILNSAKKLNQTSEIDLYEQAQKRLLEVMRLGTGAIEIKSGYGLTVAGELKMLRVIQELKQKFELPIKATFLGAHAFPTEYKDNQDGYIDLIINLMLPEIAADGLADFIDVFVETNYFSIVQTQRILTAAKSHGLVPKLHVNQFTAIDGIQTAVEFGALTVDHLEILTQTDLEALKNSKTMSVALPSCSFFIGIPYTPARQIIDFGLPLAIATDYNPGTSPSGNMNFVVALACVKMKMTPNEAINAATINAAFAMNIEHTHGSITIGKKANIIITKPLKSYYEIPYSFGSNLIEKVMINGKII